MKPPLFVRVLTTEERQALTAGLRSPTATAFAMRRCQILLASSKGERPSHIAANLGCAVQTVRNAINDFHQEGLQSLKPGSSRPKSVKPLLYAEKAEALRAILHQTPRAFGKPTSVWTLSVAAQVCHEQGLTERPVSIELIRGALRRLGVNWRRAKHWITSPDPQYERKKSVETA
jgi:transposase